MKLLFIISLLTCLNCSAQVEITDTLYIYINDSKALYVTPSNADREPIKYTTGTLSYSSKPATIASVTEAKEDERFFTIKAIKVGKSLITTSVFLADNIQLIKTFWCVVTTDKRKKGNGFTYQILDSR